MKNIIKPDQADKKENIQPETNNKKAEFESLINGEFKDLFSEKVKEIISKRLKGTEDIKNKLSKYEEIVEMLCEKFDVEKDDIDAISEKISHNSPEKETIRYTHPAQKDYSYIENLEKENQYYKYIMEQQNKNRQIEQQIKNWYAQSEEIAKEYPDFNLDSEINNEQFINLLRNGVDMKTAYQVAHISDILGADKNALTSEKQRILSQDRRPVENGLSSQSPAILKTDVSKLTPEQRALIAKRAAMGETITF